MSYIKDTGDVIGGVVQVVIGAAVVIVGLSAIGFGIYYVTAPATVAIDNRVFHQSQSYNDGMARDLDNMRSDYNKADDTGKASIRATIQHRFAGYDSTLLPPDLRNFLESVR